MASSCVNSFAILTQGVGATNSSFGPFQSVVDLVSYAVAAAGAITTTWLGKRKWHPTGEFPEKLAGLAVAVVLLLIFLVSQPFLIAIVVIGLPTAVVCGLLYHRELELNRCEVKEITGYETRDDQRFEKSRLRYFIGGDLLPAVTASGESPAEYLRRCNFQTNLVWESKSRVRNILRLSMLYIPTVVGGTATLVAAARLYTLNGGPGA